MLRVKICGITRWEDAMYAAELGADAIGLVFSERSPRFVTAEQARTITKGLPPWVARVGVFVDAPQDLIARTAAEVGLTAIQLHGQESPAYIHDLEVNLPVIKAVSMGNGWQERIAQFRGIPVLLDAADEQRVGGTGRTWAWDQFDREACPNYLILAGGLTAENVAEAVSFVQPDAVDVSTGVEQSPGIKHPIKMCEFFSAVRDLNNPPAWEHDA